MDPFVPAFVPATNTRGGRGGGASVSRTQTHVQPSSITECAVPEEAYAMHSTQDSTSISTLLLKISSFTLLVDADAQTQGSRVTARRVCGQVFFVCHELVRDRLKARCSTRTLQQWACQQIPVKFHFAYILCCPSPRFAFIAAWGPFKTVGTWPSKSRKEEKVSAPDIPQLHPSQPSPHN